MNYRNIETGQLAYDLIQNSPVVITDAHLTTIDELKPAAQEQVMGSPGNQMLGVNETDRVVEVAYFNRESFPSREYTMPEARLITPRIEKATGGLSAVDLVKKQALTAVIAAVRGHSEIGAAHLIEALEESSAFSEQVMDEAAYESGR